MKEDGNTHKKSYSIIGMHCASCAFAIESDLKEVAGVKDAYVNFTKKRADVVCEIGHQGDQRIIDAVKEAGYQAAVISEDENITDQRMSSPVRTIYKTCRGVLCLRNYAILAIVATFVFFTISVWISSGKFMIEIAMSDFYTFGTKAKIFLASLGAFKTNFSLTSQITTLVISLLVGINLSLLVFYIKRKSTMLKGVGTSTLGVLLSFLGVGCASCGSVLLSSFVGVTAATGFLGLLPLRGLEFSLLSIAIICLSIFMVSKKIHDPILCKVPVKKK